MRRDLSYNKLTRLDRHTLSSLTGLTVLKVDTETRHQILSTILYFEFSRINLVKRTNIIKTRIAMPTYMLGAAIQSYSLEFMFLTPVMSL